MLSYSDTVIINTVIYNDTVITLILSFYNNTVIINTVVYSDTVIVLILSYNGTVIILILLLTYDK